MQYHDSIEQAEKKMCIVVKQLQLWCLPVTPINYSVCYDFLNKKNKALLAAIDKKIASGQKIDDFFIEECYQQFVLTQSKFRDELIDDIDDVVSDVQQSNKQSGNSLELLISTVNKNMVNIQSEDKQMVAAAANKIRLATRKFKLQQQKIHQAIVNSSAKLSVLQTEVKEARKEVYQDSLTGLYNHKAMTKYLDVWLNENENMQVAAIVINIDKLPLVSQEFGPLISDILLTKIANKINSYVDDSGLPVRSGNEEFLILLPDIEKSIASEIAEKIRHGIEKLKFISSKSGLKLPMMTLSIGVENFNITENASHIIEQTRSLLSDVQTAR